MSGHFAAQLFDGIRRLSLACRDMLVAAGGLAMVAIVRIGQRLAAMDPAARLIGSADALEAGIGKVTVGARRVLGRRGIGLTGGLLWRGLAALTGIGLAATLVTAMSSGMAESGAGPSLASLTLQSASESRSIRDVRQAPLAHAAAEDSWVAIVRPVAMFGLDSPELDRQAPAYEAQRHPNGPRRRDDLSFGSFAEAPPHLQLRLLVEHGAEQPQPSFVVALVREAAERGMSVQRSGLATAIPTRFGPVETADATISDGQASRACIAFRKSPGELPLGLSGWWCGSSGRPADRQQLICLIDRIDLLSAGDDRALRSAFARTELGRQPACAPPRLSATGRKASWLDADGKAPVLRTKTAIASDQAKPAPKR